MNGHKIIVYDLEILKPIITDPGQRDDCPIPACGSWTNYADMGISTLCAPTLAECLTYSAQELYSGDDNFMGAYHFGPKGQKIEHAELLMNRAELLVSFNGLSFDNNVLAANGVFLDMSKCYDILHEWKRITGKRVSLDTLVKANFAMLSKSGSGILAPYEWAAGKYREVIEYCFQDCLVTAQVFSRILNEQPLVDPYTGREVRLPLPQRGLF